MFRSVYFCALCLIVAPHLRAQDQLTGEWRGHWLRAGDSLEVRLHVKYDPATKAHTATFDSDRLRVTGIPFTEVRVQGCCDVTMRLQGDRTTAVFTGVVRDATLSGDLREGASDGRFAYSRVSAEGPSVIEREVTFRNGDVTLAGSLILPSTGTAPPHPAVVFVHGSGAEGRWASRFLATTFAKHGVAGLIFDKRGVGKSSGEWRTATPGDLAGDAAAAVAFLLQERQIDARRVGIHGHSQGGTLAPMIVTRSKGVGFLIASAAAGLPTDSTEIFSILNSVYPNATTAADSMDARAYASELVAAAYHGRSRERLDSLASRFQGRSWYFAPPAPQSSYWSFSKMFGEFRPLDWWSQVRVPLLLIYGADDARVPARESAARIAGTVLRSAPDPDVTVRIVPDADHTFRLRPAPSGWARSAPDYVPTLLGWLAGVAMTRPSEHPVVR